MPPTNATSMVGPLALPFLPCSAACDLLAIPGSGAAAATCRAEADQWPLGCSCAMDRRDALACSDACIEDFENCERFGPGALPCRAVIARLSRCESECILPLLEGNSAEAGLFCSDACVLDFAKCSRYGPGALVCRREAASRSGRLARLCAAGCALFTESKVNESLE